MNIKTLNFLAFSMSSLLAFLLPIIPIYALYLGVSQFMLGLIGAVGAFSYAFFCLFLGRNTKGEAKMPTGRLPPQFIHQIHNHIHRLVHSNIQLVAHTQLS